MIKKYSLFDTLLEPLFIVDSDYKIIYCNETAATISEVSIRKITKGISFFSLFTFSEQLDGFLPITGITGPTPYKEVAFRTSHGNEGKIQITIQPLEDENTEKHWIIFFRDVTLEERLQKKYRAELVQKEHVIEALKGAKSQLENYSKNLEKMVAERTAEIQHINKTMKALLDSLNQGFFIFNEEGKVLDVSSRACEETIECLPQGKFIWDVLKLPENKVLGYKKWMQALFSEMLPFEDLVALGAVNYPHSKNRKISIDYFPIRSDKEKLEGIVVVASDITSLVDAQEQSEKDREYSKLIINLVQNKRNIGRFIRESQDILMDLESSLQHSAIELNPDSLFRQLHTLKGNSSLLSIKEMTDSCHTSETILKQLREHNSESLLNELRTESATIHSAFQRFTKQSEEILGRSALSEERLIEIPISKFNQTLKTIEENTPNNLVSKILMTEFAMESIGSYFDHYSSAAQRIADELGKKIYDIEYENFELKILPEFYTSLFSTFIHSIRNAVDHGIELPAERIKNDKNPVGKIKVIFSQVDENLRIQVSDDGAGINPEKIREKLSLKGKDSSKETDAEVIQHVFDNQISTSEKVTELSGRGVGMDAIKFAAEEIGGKAWVVSEFSKGTSLFVEVPYITRPQKQNFKTFAA